MKTQKINSKSTWCESMSIFVAVPIWWYLLRNRHKNQFSTCTSDWLVRPISRKLHSIEVLWDTINWWSYSYWAQFYLKISDLWTWSHIRVHNYGISRFWVIFKCHVLASDLAISWQTPLNWSTLWYFKLMELQHLSSFLSQKFWPLNSPKNVSCAQLWDIMILVDFQNHHPRKCWGCFPRNSTRLKYSRILQTDGVTASALFAISKIFTSEQGYTTGSRIMGYHRYGSIFKTLVRAQVLWTFPSKLDSIKVVTHTTVWWSFSFCTHFYTTYHDL